MRRGRPILAGTDQRYWRRRANRRVRKRRLARVLLRWGLVLAINGTIGVILVYSAVHALRHLAGSEEFALRHIEVGGAQRASVASIEQELTPYLGRSLLQLDLRELERRVQRDPWVRAAAVKRILPATLHVRLVEREAAAVAVIGGLAHLIDTTGYVIGPTGYVATEGLPVLTGLDGLADAELAGGLRRAMELLERLRRATPRFAEQISELDLSRDSRVMVRTVFAGPAILLDPRRVERNVGQYMELFGEIERRTGRLDYVDLRWRDRISVMPAEEMEEGG